MTSSVEAWPRHGQGKWATIVRAEQGHYVTSVADHSYVQRWEEEAARRAVRPYKGQRAMHHTTFHLGATPTDYVTHSAYHHGGRRDLPSPTRVTALPSQHHHSAVGRIIWPGNTRAFDTTSTVMFDDKQSLLQERPFQLVDRRHRKLNQEEGSQMKRVMSAPPVSSSSIIPLTQYSSVHGKLGVMLGPGISRATTARRQFNPITGAELESFPLGDEVNHRRISGNRILYFGSAVIY